MGFFSFSRSRGHYPHNSHGSEYYKRSHGSGGILGLILRMLFGSKHHSHSHSDHYHNHGSHHRRKYSWS